MWSTSNPGTLLYLYATPTTRCGQEWYIFPIPGSVWIIRCLEWTMKRRICFLCALPVPFTSELFFLFWFSIIYSHPDSAVLLICFPLHVAGLSAPVPRGRKGKKTKNQMLLPEIKNADWLTTCNPEIILHDDSYKKHLKQHCNKWANESIKAVLSYFWNTYVIFSSKFWASLKTYKWLMNLCFHLKCIPWDRSMEIG